MNSRCSINVCSAARHALSSAARHGVRIACLVFEPDDSGDAARIFGGRGAAAVHGLEDLPGALWRLLDR